MSKLSYKFKINDPVIIYTMHGRIHNDSSIKTGITGRVVAVEDKIISHTTIPFYKVKFDNDQLCVFDPSTLGSIQNDDGSASFLEFELRLDLTKMRADKISAILKEDIND